MAYIEIKSTNKEGLSWVLQKNPETQKTTKVPYSKRLRKGKIYGWFGQGTEVVANYNLLFKDSTKESSFAASGEFEYLDQTRYSHPDLINQMLNNALKSAVQDENEHDKDTYVTEVNTQLMVFSYSVFKKTVDSFNRDPNTTIEYTNVDFNNPNFYSGYSVELSIRANGIRRALAVLQVISMLQAAMEREGALDVNVDVANRIVRLFNYLGVGYYVRYLFSSRLIRHKNIFDEIKGELQLPGSQINYGDTGLQRREVLIEKVLENRTSGMKVIDVGCSEMFNSYPLLRKNIEVVAIDKDSEIMEKNKNFLTRKKCEGFELLTQEIDPQWISDNKDLFSGSFVLLTEVIEHMPEEDAVSLVRALIETKPKYLYITTPNRDFNQHFEMDEGDMRHADHDFEMNTLEFNKFITGLVTSDYTISFEGLADRVNENYCSLSALIEYRG